MEKGTPHTVNVDFPFVETWPIEVTPPQEGLGRLESQPTIASLDMLVTPRRELSFQETRVAWRV